MFRVKNMNVVFWLSDTAQARIRADKESAEALQDLRISGCVPVFAGTEEPDWNVYALDDTVLISDLTAFTAVGTGRGYCCIGFAPENGASFFEGVQTVVGSVKALSAPFLWQTLSHHLGIPFVVAQCAAYTLRESVPDDFPYLLPLFEACCGNGQHVLAGGLPVGRNENREAQYSYFKAYTENVYRLFGYGMWTAVIDREPAGWFGICPPDGSDETTGQPQLAYILKKSLQGRGLAGRICSDVIRYAKNELCMEKLSAWIHEDNLPSTALVRSLGFFEEGRASDNPQILHFILPLV